MASAREFRFGQGKISGTLSLVMSLLALGAVICFHHPDALTTPQLREVYPVAAIRVLIWIFIGFSVGLGLLSYHLDPQRRTGLFGLLAAVAALALGGGGVAVATPVPASNYVGLDWFLLDLIICAVFIPLERLFALHRVQKIFRAAWKLDLGYFFVNHVLIQLILVVTAAPALWVGTRFQDKFFPAIATWNPVLQFLAIMLAVDLCQYWVHRAFHRVSWLWKFHAVHHSVEEMDWLAGSRLHLVDILTRSVLFLPLTLVAFSPGVLMAYLVATAFGTVFTHSNIRWRFPVIEWLITTPVYHHWHHSSEKAALDTNFAVHLPVLDRIFGTHHLPRQWPKKYGLDRERLPGSIFGQLVYPFK